jgi:hypothetical protein
MGAAETLFEQNLAEGEAGIARIVAERQEEHLNLDYKLSAGDNGQMERDDRKSLAEALSGFGNSDGGVIVWGVEAKRVDGIDAAVDLKPVAYS